MDAIQHIIVDHTLTRIGDAAFADYLCHAYCYGGFCTFEKPKERLRPSMSASVGGHGLETFHDQHQQFRFEAGDCMIIPRRGDLVKDLHESDDFKVDVIYVTQQFIELSTPQSNYGMRGQLSLFQNPIMRLTPEQQEVCKHNFDAVIRRLAQTEHSFRHDALMNAVECMIIDFFDFHSKLYGADRITSQQHQLMEQFIEMLERGDFRRKREISYYADKLCVTTKYLSEVSKKVSGLPAAFWITRYASLDISRLLRNRDLSFTDISDMFGFSSLSHFSRYVQTNLGAKPSDFRE